METLAGRPADAYAAELLVKPMAGVLGVKPSPQAIFEEIRDPRQCLCVIYGCIAFSRRGKDRLEIAQTVCDALDEVIEKNPQFLSSTGAVELWTGYSALARSRGRKPHEQLERGPIHGIAELAQELVQSQRKSIADWIFASVRRNGRVEEIVERVVDIKGVGPKVGAILLRDFIHIADLEDRVNFVDRRFLQPIDKWVRHAAPFFVPDLAEKDADWILSGKIAKHARLAGLSGIRLNMGITYLGRHSGTPFVFERQLERFGRLAEPLHGDSQTVEGESRLEGLDGLAETMEHGA
jgi:hypothetical protein